MRPDSKLWRRRPPAGAHGERAVGAASHRGGGVGGAAADAAGARCLRRHGPEPARRSVLTFPAASPPPGACEPCCVCPKGGAAVGSGGRGGCDGAAHCVSARAPPHPRPGAIPPTPDRLRLALLYRTERAVAWAAGVALRRRARCRHGSLARAVGPGGEQRRRDRAASSGTPRPRHGLHPAAGGGRRATSRRGPAGRHGDPPQPSPCRPAAPASSACWSHRLLERGAEASV